MGKTAKAPDVEALLLRYKPHTTYSNNGPRCRIGTAVPKVGAVITALRARQVTHAEIARIIVAEFGVDMTRDSVRRHVNGECRCKRDG
jgi:hypothetical protein